MRSPVRADGIPLARGEVDELIRSRLEYTAQDSRAAPFILPSSRNIPVMMHGLFELCGFVLLLRQTGLAGAGGLE